MPDGVLFRVRVVQPPGPEHHKLLGEADGIPFVKAGEADDRRRHLLVPVPDALDQQLWKLDLERDPPCLLVNKDAKPSWKEMARRPQFIALVYPEVLRQLLTRALVEADPWTEDDEEGELAGGLGAVPLGAWAASGRCRRPTSESSAKSGLRRPWPAFARRHELRGVWDLSCEQEGGR